MQIIFDLNVHQPASIAVLTELIRLLQIRLRSASVENKYTK